MFRLVGDHLADWEALVRSEHGESLALRSAARAAARALADFLSARRPDPEDAALLGRWYVPVILELQRCEGFRPEVDWLMARLWPTPDTDELTRALRLLREGDLLGDRRSVATERQLDDEAMARMARAYHRQQLEHASQAIDEVPSADRYLGSLSVAVRRDDLPALIEALHLFQLSVIEPHRAVDADLVVQVNVQLFPRTRE